MPVETTPGGLIVTSDPGPNANSYASIALYKEILSIYPNRDISQDTDDQIGGALVTATNTLDNEYGWPQLYLGTLYDATYATFFPREGITNIRTGEEYTDFTVFPEELQRGTAIMAWYLIQNERYKEIIKPGLDLSSYQATGTISEQKLEGLGQLKFDSSYMQYIIDKLSGSISKPTVIPYEVASMISGLLIESARPTPSTPGTSGGLKIYQLNRG